MKPKILIGILAFIGLCSGIYAQVINPKSIDEDYCSICQPNNQRVCETYIIDNEGGYGLYVCSKNINIYDVTPPEE